MKLTVCLSASLVALLALPGGSRGATPADGPVNPYANVDPDGVPLSVTQSDDDKITPKQAETLEKQQADQQFRERNWLLLEYEQEFRHNNAQATTPDRTLNMYLQLSMNRDLAAVSRDSSEKISNPTPAPAPSLHATPNTTSTQNGITLRPDSSLGKNNFAPLISPFNSSFASSASQPYTTSAYSSALPSSLAPGSSLGATQSPAPAPAPRPSPTPLPAALPTSPPDTVDMQTPGMIADKSNPLPGMPSLNLDSLPDPNAPDPQNPQQSQDLPELRQPMDAGLLHHELNAKLAPAQPGQATAAEKKPLPAPVPPPAPPPPETPEPISKQPQLSPVHAPLTSPLDMFNH